MEPNLYEAPQEVGYDPPGAIKRESETWIGAVLWIVTLALGTIILTGLLRPSFD